MGEYYGDSGTWKLISKQLSQMGQAVLKMRLRGGRKRDRKRKPSSWTRTTLIGGCKKKKKKQQGDEKQAGKGPNQPALSKTEEGWAGSHPWKPWDREKDLTAGRQSVNLDPKKFTEGLTARFGATQDAPRKFL
jgi:hypothetical protein